MLVTREYNRDHALEYAREWAFTRNPLYRNYSGIGGDCTSFVSQSVFAGSCQMNYTPIFGWYYLDENSRTASWTGVQYFYNFITGNRGVGPYGEETEETNIRVGDVVQLRNSDGVFYHSLIVSGYSREEGILVSAHSDDAFDRSLGSYSFAGVRYIHIDGVRFDVDVSTDSCFDDLLGGIAIVP